MDDINNTKDTMTYAEYISRFTMMQSIKKNLLKLNLPLDEVPYLSSMSEEELFIREWDINHFGLNKIKNSILSKMWIEKEQHKFTDPNF